MSDLNSAIEKKLNENPTWKNVIDLFLEIQSENIVFRELVIEHVMSLTGIETLEDRNKFKAGVYEKIKISSIGVRNELMPPVIAKLMES